MSVMPSAEVRPVAKLKASKRRPSLDSLNSKHILQRLSPEAVRELLPTWLYRLLVLGGGITGNEHPVLKALLLLCAVVQMASAMSSLWFVGMPLVPDVVVLGTVGIGLNFVNLWVRWQFLQSGILWSLAERLDLDGHILGAYNSKSRMMIFLNEAESFLVFGSFTICGLYLDVSGRAASLGEELYAFFWAASLSNLLFLHLIVHSTVKTMPMLFIATYDLIVEKMRRFHSSIDSLFAEDIDEARPPTEVLEKLQQLETELRAQIALVNQGLSPQLGRLLGSILVIMSGCVIFAILHFKKIIEGTVFVTSFYCWVACIMCTMCITILKSAARVGDRWIQLVDDLNTPQVCVSSMSVLGVPLADRLLRLQNTGIRVWGCAINSRTVFSMSTTMVGGLALALLGTLLTT